MAEALSATTADVLPGVVFGAGGGEAVDVAIKCCRAATKRRGVVSVSGGYHGHTGLALAAGDPSFREPVLSSAEAFCQVPFNDLAAMDRALTADVAAVILEPIPATLGMPLPQPGYLEGVSALCRARGAKLVVDEVQTGLGRTGKLWAYQHHDLQPDVLVCGKGLGGGLYPISATLMTPELHALFLEHPFIHVSTCGGAELGCQLALKVLEITQRPGLLEQVEQLGAQLEAGLTSPAPEGHASFAVRRRGLMLGLKLSAPGAAILAMQALIKRGVFALYAAHDTSVVQLMPPLILQPSQADDLVERIRGALFSS